MDKKKVTRKPPAHKPLVLLLLKWGSNHPKATRQEKAEARKLVAQFLEQYPIYAQAEQGAQIINRMAETCAGILGDAGEYLEAIGTIPGRRG